MSSNKSVGSHIKETGRVNNESNKSVGPHVEETGVVSNEKKPS